MILKTKEINMSLKSFNQPNEELQIDFEHMPKQADYNIPLFTLKETPTVMNSNSGRNMQRCIQD